MENKIHESLCSALKSLTLNSTVSFTEEGDNQGPLSCLDCSLNITVPIWGQSLPGVPFKDTSQSHEEWCRWLSQISWHRDFCDVPPRTFPKNLSPLKSPTHCSCINTLPFLLGSLIMALLPLHSSIFLFNTVHAPCWAPVSLLTKSRKWNVSLYNLLPWNSSYHTLLFLRMWTALLSAASEGTARLTQIAFFKVPSTSLGSGTFWKGRKEAWHNHI